MKNKSEREYARDGVRSVESIQSVYLTSAGMRFRDLVLYKKKLKQIYMHRGIDGKILCNMKKHD